MAVCLSVRSIKDAAWVVCLGRRSIRVVCLGVRLFDDALRAVCLGMMTVEYFHGDLHYVGSWKQNRAISGSLVQISTPIAYRCVHSCWAVRFVLE